MSVVDAAPITRSSVRMYPNGVVKLLEFVGRWFNSASGSSNPDLTSEPQWLEAALARNFDPMYQSIWSCGIVDLCRYRSIASGLQIGSKTFLDSALHHHFTPTIS